MQRVDDVTGEPIQLSATQREQWRRETQQRVEDLIQANNQIYARLHGVLGEIKYDVTIEAWHSDTIDDLRSRIASLEEARSEFALEVKPAIWRELGLLDDKIVTLQCLSLFERLRWLVLGR